MSNKICIELMNGDKINAVLCPEIAPRTVENFLKLVNEHFYDGMIFHRVIKDFMSQGGGYYVNNEQQLCEKNTESIVGEFSSNGVENNLSHVMGTLSMARTNDPNSAGGQFFICSSNAKFLDGNYAAFGYIYDTVSMANAEKLNKVPTTTLGNILADFPDTNLHDIMIKTISILAD